MLPSLPAPHLLLHDFLPPGDHQALLAWALANEIRFTAAGVGGALVDPTQRRCVKLSDLGPSSEVFQQLVHAAFPTWLQQLRVNTFQLAKLELQLVAYNEGAHFAFHIDAAPPSAQVPARNRRLTGVYYFFQQPQQFTGGDLRLYHLGARPGSQAYTTISPQQNTLLVFPSWVGHEVTPVHCPTGTFADSRFAVNCWLHQPAPEPPNQPTRPATT